MGTGIKAVNKAISIIEDLNHFFQKIDGGSDTGLDGYIRIRKKIEIKKNINGTLKKGYDYVDTGNLVGVQIKGVTSTPSTGSNSYYVNIADKKKFGVNFKSKDALDKKRKVWRTFIGPVILIFVDLNTKKCWWTDLNNEGAYQDNGYMVEVNKSDELTSAAFKQIKKLGKESFKKK
jgi:hypothetical protein